VRDLALELPLHWSAAPRSEIQLGPEDAGAARAVRIPPGVTYEFSLGGLASTGIEKLAEAIAKPPILVEAARPTAEAAPAGIVLAVSPVARPDGPTPLPRQSADPLNPDADTRLDRLRPYLIETVLPFEGSGGGVLQVLRPHQLEAFQALLAQESLLLADDLGTGKTVTACLAILALFQRGQAKRMMVVCPDSQRREWAAALADWCPGLLVTAVHGSRSQRALDWASPAHVLLADYETLAADLERDLIDAARMDIDLVVLDSVLGARRLMANPAEPAIRLRPRRRWALAGALPEEREDWLAVFRFLTPGLANVGAGTSASELRRRFAPHFLRRSKPQIAGDLPPFARQRLWMDLDDRQWEAYREMLAEERHRLKNLGGALTRTHVIAALDRMTQGCNFLANSFDGVKVRALVTMAEEVSAGGGKMVVFSPQPRQSLTLLLPVLQAYGVIDLGASGSEQDRIQSIQAFRHEPRFHVLLADVQSRLDGRPLVEASYLVHFDHALDPLVARRAEMRLRPDGSHGLPLNIYEMWTTGTHEERLFCLLAERGLLEEDLYQQEEVPGGELSLDDLMQQVLEVPTAESPAPREAAPHPMGSGWLPGTDMLRSQLAGLSPENLMAGVAGWMQALGYPHCNPAGEPTEAGGDLVASRETDAGMERVLVRSIRSEKNVGIGEAKILLKEASLQDCVGAYLIATSDFTPACKKHADQAGGKLALVSGAELWRHLHILGWFG